MLYTNIYDTLIVSINNMSKILSNIFLQLQGIRLFYYYSKNIGL